MAGGGARGCSNDALVRSAVLSDFRPDRADYRRSVAAFRDYRSIITLSEASMSARMPRLRTVSRATLDIGIADLRGSLP